MPPDTEQPPSEDELARALSILSRAASTRATVPADQTPPEAEQGVKMSENAASVPPRRRRWPALRVSAVLAVAAAAFFVAWLALRGGGEARTPAAASAPPPVAQVRAASESELQSLAESLNHPVYWAGAKRNYTYELTRLTDGRIYIRYLPAGVKIGDNRPLFLTIGTYPRKKAFAELERAARGQGAVRAGLPGGGLMVFSAAKPTSVYFGYRRARYQVEVYHPSANTARRLVLSGKVVPVH